MTLSRSAARSDVVGQEAVALVTPTPGILTTPTPTPIATATPVRTATPVASATATPRVTPSAKVAFYSGEVLDVQHGYIFFTTGDAFRLAVNVSVTDLETGKPLKTLPATKMYAEAIFDATGQIIALNVANHPLPSNAAYQVAMQKYAVALSSPVPNPELNPNRPRGGPASTSRIPLTGKIVEVRFIVEVPPDTPLQDPVYLSTDVSGWNPQAIRMERVDALHYQVTLPLRTGTNFYYKYTRGSWQASERGRTGIEENPRHFFLGATPFGEPDTQVRNDEVFNWSDFNPAGGQAIGPNSIPTPFNPMPFGFPTPPAAPTPPGTKK
jgi:hypothetical protein